MPLLGQLLVTLFGSFFASLAKDATRKAATLAAAFAAIVAAGVALMLVFNNTVSPLVSQVFNTQYGQFLGLAFPPVAGTCISAFTTCWVACGTYRLYLQITQASASS